MCSYLFCMIQPVSLSIVCAVLSELFLVSDIDQRFKYQSISLILSFHFQLKQRHCMVPHPVYQRQRGRRENMLGLHLNPNKRRLILALSVRVYTNEQTTDRVTGDPFVWVCPMKPLTLLRGRDREQRGMLEAERGWMFVTTRHRLNNSVGKESDRNWHFLALQL